MREISYAAAWIEKGQDIRVVIPNVSPMIIRGVLSFNDGIAEQFKKQRKKRERKQEAERARAAAQRAR